MTKFPFVSAALLPALLLSGCNMAPRYARPVPAVPPALPQGQGVYPAPDAAQAQDLARIGWREFFRDERLRQVIDLGLANNQDLALAVANVLQARAQYRVQRSDLFPAISASGSGTYTNTASFAASAGSSAVGSTNVQYFNGNVGLSSFEIDLFGRLRNLTKAAQEEYLASEEGRRATRITLIGEIASAWLTLAADRDQLATSQKTLDAYAQTLDLTKAQFRIGTTSALEMQQAETSYQSARNDIAVLQTQVAQDLNALQLLTGAPVPAALQPQGLGTSPPTIEALPGNLASDVLLRRPDVLQAEHKLIAQNANIGAARAAFFPTISLTATIGTISSTLSNLFSAGTGTYTLSPSVSVPLFNFGQNKGNLDYAKASRDAALATYQKTIQTAFREVADALAQRGTIDEQLAAQTARAKAASQAAMLSDARYRAGVESFLTALDSQRSAYTAEQQLVTTRLNRANNLVTLYRTLGGGLD